MAEEERESASVGLKIRFGTTIQLGTLVAAISLREIEELFLAQLKKPAADHPGDFYIEKPKDT